MEPVHWQKAFERGGEKNSRQRAEVADRSAETFEHMLDAAAPEHCRKSSSATSFGSAEMDISSFLMVKESTENTAVLAPWWRSDLGGEW